MLRNLDDSASDARAGTQGLLAVASSLPSSCCSVVSGIFRVPNACLSARGKFWKDIFPVCSPNRHATGGSPYSLTGSRSPWHLPLPRK